MDIVAWNDFFGVQVAGAAALLGLMFVAISLNLTKVLSERALPDRAILAMALLFAIILTSSLALLPGQPAFALGLELLAIGLLVTVVGFSLERRILRSAAGRGGPSAINILLLAAAALPQIAGGALLLGGSVSGLYWVAAAILACLGKAILDAWVLLVEINR